MAAAAYFAIVFAAGFVLGTVRVLALEPVLGPVYATLAELPFMLAISWAACAWIIRRFRVPPDWTHRLGMGAGAFALLIGAEILLGVVGFGRPLAEQLRSFAELATVLGLLGQVAYACFPLIQARWAED